ncbi:MAG: FAD-binding oxidoreductase, partial [Bacteroidales bacterium]
NVDMGKYKAETLQQYYDTHGIPLRARLIASFSQLSSLGSLVPGLYNFVSSNKLTATVIRKMAGFSTKRSLPALHTTTLRKWADKNLGGLNAKTTTGKKVVLFCDEFTNYNDTSTGINAILLLNRLGYWVDLPPHVQSGRAALSKGMLKKAKEYARENVKVFAPRVSPQTPLVGIEPSAILTFRDEYPALLEGEQKLAALSLAENVMTIEEFICQQHDEGRLDTRIFTAEKKTVHYHGHCHQKALSSIDYGLRMMSLAPNKSICPISCGCCGMAGAFGFEKEHYELSMQIGELQLFPAIRQADPQDLIAASGTSCRHQILDGTGRKAWHPVDILHSFLE